MNPQIQPSSQPEIIYPSQPPHHAPLGMESRGLAGSMGIHPAIAAFTLACDVMLFGGEAMTLGASLPLSLLVSCAVGYVTYHGQQAWYRDSRESAKTKAVMLAILTVIPSSIPAFIYIPLGILGLFRKKS